MHWSHRLLVLWTVAAAVHLPMPVGDGDDLKSGESLFARAAPASCWDIDFILLGCDPPDDCDDGPVDDDPESGSGSPLGSYLIHIEAKSPDFSARARVAPAGGLASRAMSGGVAPLGKPRISRLRSDLYFSFGKSCQSGLAVMRC